MRIKQTRNNFVSDLVFGGQPTGEFDAFDAHTGELLWQYDRITAMRSLSSRCRNHRKKELAMAWTTPAFIDVNMSAEIGAYQDDFEERIPVPEKPALRPEPDEA